MKIGAHVQYAQSGAEEIRSLMIYTDSVAEIQSTLRVETPVTLSGIEVVTI
jgi:hypothetical protein